jgi:hypothetical protein
MSKLIRALLLGAATGLVACGGGSDKSDPKPSSSASAVSVSSLSSSILPSSSSSILSSTLPVSSSSLPASSSSMQSSSVAPVSVKVDGTVSAFDLDGNDVELDSELLTIEVNLLDENDNSLQSVTPIAGNFGAEKSLRFNADLSGDTSGTVAITVSYPGYTSYSRKLDAKQAIIFDAKLQTVPVQTVEINEATSISGTTVEGFNINVSADSDDQQSDSMQIQIPSSLLPEGTESLDVAVRTFDPNDENDREFFPGAYADSDGNKLASVAFNFAEINTGAGEPLMQAMRKARQQKIAKAGGAHKVAADEPVIINRQIPEQSCRLLESLGDSDNLSPGFQVPVYTYNPNTGLWDLLGHGTIYNEQGIMASETQQQFDCGTTDFYLEILVTNEIFLSDWWNLDYPLTFTEPVNYCARIQVKNAEGETLAGISGYAWDENGDMDFAVTDFTTDGQGIADIQVAQAGNESQAVVYFYDASQYGFVKKTITLSTSCAAPEVQVIELVRPSMCSVSGNLAFKNGSPVEREMVYAIPAEGTSEFGYDFVNSDAQGNYRLSLPCKGIYQVIPVSQLWLSESNTTSWLHTSTDGSIQTDELSDDGKSVVMKPVQVDYIKPLAYGFYAAETKDLMLYFYSNYSAFPMTFTATVKSQDGQTSYGPFTGTVSASAVGDGEGYAFFNMGEVQLKYDLPDQADGYTYLLNLNITDAFNNNWTNIESFIYVGRDQEFPDETEGEEPNP